jgi:hypothetical protein
VEENASYAPLICHSHLFPLPAHAYSRLPS